MLEKENLPQGEFVEPPVRPNRWLPVAAVVLLIATLVSLYFLAEEHRQARQLATGYDQMSVLLSQTRSQLEAVTAKLNGLNTAPPAENALATAPQPEPVGPTSTPAESKSRRAVSHRAGKKRAPADDPRWKQMQAELEKHQNEISATQQDVQKTRSDLEGNLNSTRDELNGSIARTHEELVVLQKRGERNYFEFDLAKDKQFHRTGPLSISLRKADSKRKYCDVKMLIDDNEITKKHVNLYEPVMLYPTDYAHPVELVINQINKDAARGYVSAPKYRQSELAVSTGSAAATSSSGTTTGTTGIASTPDGTAESPSSTSTASLEHRPGTSTQSH